ncbi:uncharacterized protein LOC120336524 [Styela clava]|uniref:uncharacterized protein LOC120336524 n=1 Tax=Styela clava TaxID=7725 RepID=UPI001939C01C|nr:uncharacterized protein LOC120336524 [Styela clava]
MGLLVSDILQQGNMDAQDLTCPVIDQYNFELMQFTDDINGTEMMNDYFNNYYTDILGPPNQEGEQQENAGISSRVNDNKSDDYTHNLRLSKRTTTKNRNVIRKNSQISHKKKRADIAKKGRQSLKLFNQAMTTLQNVIPVRLPKGRKLQKKQILQFAIQYIQFLRECRDGKKDFSERHRFLWREGTTHSTFIDAIEAAATKSR